MADQTQDTRTDEAPEKPEARLPLQKEFLATGEERIVDLVPVAEGTPEKRVIVQYGILSTWRGDETPKKSGRFQITYPVVIDGMQNDVEVLSADAGKGIAQAIKQATNKSLSADDFTFDLDDEYFEQKYEAPKVDKDDVWTNPDFADRLEVLADLSGRAEGVLEAQDEAQRATQAQAFELGDVLKEAYLAVGKSRKALQSWATGGTGANHPHLKRMGKGTNALYEAMKFADLSETQREVLPGTLTSGKGLERHRSLSIEKMVEDVVGSAMEWPDGYETQKIGRMPDLAGYASIIRRVANKTFGVENVADKDLTQLGEEAANRAADVIGEFLVEYGKTVNTYDKDEYGAALTAYGMATLCDSGSDNLFIDAINGLIEISESDLDEKAVGERLTKLTSGNLFLTKAVRNAWAHRQTIDKERQNREILKDVVDDETGPITKKAQAGFGKLDALPAAAHLFKLMCSHPDAKNVWAQLQSLARQHSEQLNPKKEGSA